MTAGEMARRRWPPLAALFCRPSGTRTLRAPQVSTGRLESPLPTPLPLPRAGAGTWVRPGSLGSYRRPPTGGDSGFRQIDSGIPPRIRERGDPPRAVPPTTCLHPDPASDLPPTAHLSAFLPHPQEAEGRGPSGGSCAWKARPSEGLHRCAPMIKRVQGS